MFALKNYQCKVVAYEVAPPTIYVANVLKFVDDYLIEVAEV
jgi:hypothetical protein